MKHLPNTENPVVVRTDFSDDAAWDAIKMAVTAPVGPDGFLANIEFVDDKGLDNKSTEAVLDLVHEDSEHSFVILADRHAMITPEHPLLVDLGGEPGRTFRALPRTVQGIENNLSLANMDFIDIVESVADDGVFRGFSD